MNDRSGPPLPPGRHIELIGRGTTFFREVAGPPGAPVLFLLHGWTATADLNWFTCYGHLGERFRVVAMDHRGHGRGIRNSHAFRLSDCADDAVALADRLGIDRFIPVGYSMGGTVAQLVWKRHRDRVDGLVLAATAGHFVSGNRDRIGFGAMRGIGTLSRIAPAAWRESVSHRLYVSRKTMTWEKWAADQVAMHEWSHILEAGAALGRYDSRGWLPTVDVPVSVLMTTGDHVVPPSRQRALVDLIPDVDLRTIDADHDAVFARAGEFVPLLAESCASVHARAMARADRSR